MQRFAARQIVWCVPDGKAYDGELDDVFSLQSDIAQAVAVALQVQLMPSRGEMTAKHHVPKFETYDHYLLATQLMSHGVQLQTAASELRQAVALDPAYAEAWAQLAMAQSFIAEKDPDSPIAATDRRRAMAAAQRAVLLDPQLGAAYASRGYLRAEHEHDWDGALADLRKSLRFDPSDARNQLRYGYVLAAIGRLRQAEAAIATGIKHDPLFPPLWNMLGRIRSAQGDAAGARRAIQRQLAINPEATDATTYLEVLALLDGDAATAYAIAAKVDRQSLLAMAKHGCIRSGCDAVLGKHV